MMRTLFESAPVPTVATFSGRGKVRGTARYIIRAFDSNEEVPTDRDAVPVATWIKTLAGQPLRSDPPTNLKGPSEVVVPLAVVEAVSPDSLLFAEWEFVPDAIR
jgi:hypothetical protein